MHKNAIKGIDLGVLLLLPFLAAFISIFIKVNFLTSILLYFGLPAIYLSFRKSEKIKKAALFSVLWSVPLWMVVDYIGIINKMWFVPSIFPFKFLGLAPFEDIIFGILFTYIVILFYELFFGKRKTVVFPERMKFLVVGGIVLLTVFFIIYFLKPTLFYIPFFYLWAGLILGLVPVLLFLFLHHEFTIAFVKVEAYFFTLLLLFELTALSLGQWIFPGTSFIGWINLFGFVFPFEELFFWIIIAPLAVLTYYKFFD